MQDALALMEQHSVYFSFMFAALCSFFFSLPTDLNPISAFALIFQEIGKKVNLPERSDGYKRLASFLAFSLIFFPIVLIISQLYLVAFKPFVIDIVVIFVLLSWHDKIQLYNQINYDLQQNNLAKAKLLLSPLTLRDTKPLSLLGTNKAVIESLVLHLTNGWFAVLFWYLVGGIYAALFYQLIFICAQQWNCKLPRYKALGQIPSIITIILQLPVHLLLSFTFSLYDRPIAGIITKFKHSIDWHHFSSGLLLSSFALSIQTQLGGVRLYESEKVTYASIGFNKQPTADRVTLAIQRLILSAWFWLICISLYEFFPKIVAYFNGTY
tara:strand:- start:1341 stop:2315 length:975 start_codon:yes stop_codon:yes gene_type:complete